MKYYVSLFQKLKKIYESQSGQQNEEILLCPSQRVFTNEELNLLTPKSLISVDKTLDSFNKKRDVSYQLNSLPSSNLFWDINPSNTLFDRYKDILDSIQPKKLEENLINLNLDIQSKLVVNRKETKKFKTYIKYLELLQNSINEIENHLQKYEDQSSEDQIQLWSEKLTILKTKTKLAYAELSVKGFKNEIEPILEEMNKKSDFENYIQLVESTKSFFEIAEKTDIDSLEDYHGISFIPYDFMKSDSGWNKLKLSKLDLDSEYQNARLENKNIPQEILSIDYDEKYITDIELDYSFIHLKRSWFNKNILESSFFDCQENKPISDGKTISNDFMISAYPKTMMLIKNLKINIDSNIPETEITNVNQVIQFGPIVMKSQLFINQNTNEKFVKAITNKETLQSSQLNYKLKKANTNASIVELPLNRKNETVSIKNATFRSFNLKTNTKIEKLNKKEPNSINTQSLIAKNIDNTKFFLKPEFITKINPTILNVLNTKVTIKLINKIAREVPIYKCEISIIGNGTNFILEIETNQESIANCSLPKGLYSIECRLDGFKLFKSSFKVESTNNLSLEYLLEPDVVFFNSYFLIGMVCEKLTKINNINN